MASKRRRRRRECAGKQRYGSEGLALGMIGFLGRIGKLRPGVHAYPCQFCGGWHIGRAGKRLRRRRIKVWQWNMGV